MSDEKPDTAAATTDDDDPIIEVFRLVKDEEDEDADDGFIVSVEEIFEDVTDKVKQPFEWLLGRKR